MIAALRDRSAVATGDLRSRHRIVHLRAGMFLATFMVGVVYMVPTPVYWDAWDYSAQAIRGHSSDLLLGRWWFIAAMRAAYLTVSAFGAGPLDVFTAMQTLNGMFLAGGTVFLMAWTYRLTRSHGAEFIAALLVLTGPLMGIYATAIMTEPMALLLLSAGFYFWQRGVEAPTGQSLQWALACGACLGMLTDIREPAVFLALWPVVSVFVQKPAKGWKLLGLAVFGAAVTLGVGIWMAWQWYPQAYTGRTYLENLHHWTQSMSRERSAFGIDPLSQLRYLAEYSIVGSPVTALGLVFAALFAASLRHVTFWVFLASAGYLATLLINHDLGVNPRFTLPWLWAAIPMVAWAIDLLLQRGRVFMPSLLPAGLVLIGLMGAVAHGITIHTMSDAHFGQARSVSKQYRVLLALPDEALLIPGPSGTPVAYHLNRLGRKEFEIIGSGWDWPGDNAAIELRSRVEQAIAEGRSVFVNMDQADYLRVRRDTGEYETIQQVASRYQQVRREEMLPFVQWVPRRAERTR